MLNNLEKKYRYIYSQGSFATIAPLTASTIPFSNNVSINGQNTWDSTQGFNFPNVYYQTQWSSACVTAPTVYIRNFGFTIFWGANTQQLNIGALNTFTCSIRLPVITPSFGSDLFLVVYNNDAVNSITGDCHHNLLV